MIDMQFSDDLVEQPVFLELHSVGIKNGGLTVRGIFGFTPVREGTVQAPAGFTCSVDGDQFVLDARTPASVLTHADMIRYRFDADAAVGR